MPKKKLIETCLPLDAINAEAEREKTARTGMPSAVHIWWSRRSLAAARATLFASLVDDPSEHPEIFTTEKSQRAERNRLMKLTAELAKVENSFNNYLFDAARKEIAKSAEGPLPVVFDPFVGGGSIPVEAHRLGLKTVSADLNPVAAIITTIVSDVPARFEGHAPVHPREDMIQNIALSGAKGFAEDVLYYGQWMQQEAWKRIGHLYPRVNGTDAAAWIWARAVKCPNPSCKCMIPLSSSYDLARKKGCEAWVVPIVENGAVRFRIHREPHQETSKTPKVAQTAVFRCPVCGEITTDAYVKEYGQSHQFHDHLIAVVVDNEKKRLFLEPDTEQETAAQVLPPKDVPHGKLPNNPRRFSPPSFGMTDYADLFTPRQLNYITTMMQLAKEAENAAKAHAIKAGFADDGIPFANGGYGALAYAQAIRMTLVVTVSKLLDRCSNVCSWDASGVGSLRNVFSRAAMPMIWDFAEGNPFSSASGSFLNALERTCDALMNLPADVEGSTYQADAAVPMETANVLLSTDLPYFDRAGYADLSDFFYVWLRYGIKELYPSFFKEELSPKVEELTSFSYRWNGNKKQAMADYAEGLQAVCKNLYSCATDQYPLNIATFYQRSNDKSTDDPALSEWEITITAICNAGFMITASWPLGRKQETSIDLAEARGIPITLILRTKPDNACDTTRRAFVAALKRELPDLTATMAKRVDLYDLKVAILGKAWNIFTRYRQVLDADGTRMAVYQTSRIIEQELDTILSLRYKEEV